MTKTPQHNVPELRFPEFEGEWEEKKLGDTGVFRKSYSFSRAKEGEGIYKHVHYGDIHLKLPEIVYDDHLLPQIEENEDFVKVQRGDLIFADASEDYEDLGKAITLDFNPHNIIAGLHTHLFTLEKNYDNKFLINYTKTNKYRTFIRKVGTGISVLGISKKSLSNFSILIPFIDEQEKIGMFFSKLDRQIELEEKKLELLEQQKKGYMQKIFSQELRFKDENGNEYPEWEIEKLGNLIYEVNEKTTSNNQYILLSSTKKGLLTQEEYFKKQIGSKDSTGYKILRLNQLVLSPQNLWLGNINLNQRFDIGIVSPSYRIYNLTRNFDINFAKNLLKSPRYIYEYAQASEQGASVVRRNLNLDLFYSIKISLPQIAEQERIGVFLDKLDNLIKTQSIKLDHLKQRKQALLQKMFV
ncbi:restriction endonuclease subunit S [Staphylococcus agnetis]|uniref:restriction endonuclease subunit S n=1 Tax=Staphylococcus agnetis TaxID=985762 RepID=UPI000D030C4C|nr:restriction endonuclease subunit S [Staphylococcus agnetis]